MNRVEMKSPTSDSGWSDEVFDAKVVTEDERTSKQRRWMEINVENSVWMVVL